MNLDLDPRDHLGDDRLRQIYGRQAGTVAFVDESYLQHAGGNGFYSLAAVLVERSSSASLPLLRAELLRVADSTHHGSWHTVRAHYREDFSLIDRMLSFVAAQVGWQVVAIDLPVRSAAEAAAARERCLGTLFEEVCKPGNNAKVVVMDTRDQVVGGPHDREDYATVRALHRTGLTRAVGVTHADDAREPLLWMADAVAWAARRALTHNETRWWEHGREVATALHARSGYELSLEMQQRLGSPRNAVGILTAPDAVGRSGGRQVVADPLSHQGRGEARESFAPTPDPHERPMMDSLRAQVRAIEQQQREDAARRRGTDQAKPPGNDSSQRDDALPPLTSGQLIAKGMRSGVKPTPPLLTPGAQPAWASREQPRPPKAPWPRR